MQFLKSYHFYLKMNDDFESEELYNLDFSMKKVDLIQEREVVEKRRASTCL